MISGGGDSNREALLPSGAGFQRKFATPRLRDLVVKEGALMGYYGPGRARLLDAGSGDGRNGVRLVKGFGCRPDRLVFLENDPAQLALSRHNWGEAVGGAPRAAFVRGDLYRAPFADGAFDLILALGDVPSLSGGRPADALSEFRRLLAPSGVVIFSLITREYLLRLAARDFAPQGPAEVEATGGLKVDYGDGTVIPHVSLGPTADLRAKLEDLGLHILQRMETRFDFEDVPARLLFACQKG